MTFVNIILLSAAAALASTGPADVVHVHMTAAEGGHFYGPGGIGEMRGYPKEVQPVGQAKDETIARRLWELSEDLTGVSYRF